MISIEQAAAVGLFPVQTFALICLTLPAQQTFTCTDELQTNKVPNQTKIVPSQTNKAPSQTNKVQNQTKPAKFQTKQIKFQTKPTKFQTNKVPNQQSFKPNQQSSKLCCYCYCIKPTSRYTTRVWKILHIPVKKTNSAICYLAKPTKLQKKANQKKWSHQTKSHVWQGMANECIMR